MSLHVAPLEPDQVDACARLFEAYPYKIAQQRHQRLDRARLNAFYLAGLRKAVASGTPHWAAWPGRAWGAPPLAVAGLAGGGWHDGIYGMKLGKIQPWLATLDPAAAAPLLAAVRAGAAARGLEHLSVRLDGEDFPNLHLFETEGFRLVDVSLKFSAALPLAAASRPRAPADAAALQVAEASAADHAWIRALGSTTHGGTHFLNDPRLPRERTVALFAAWLEKCLAGLAWRVYVLKDAAGTGLGFVTYLRAGGFAQAVGRTPLILDFVLLAPAARGRGLGPWFIAETLHRAQQAAGAADPPLRFDYCELRTSAHNLAAVLNYEKLGFRLCATDFVLHG